MATLAVSLLALVPAVLGASLPAGQSLFTPPALALENFEELATTGNFTFQQFIDHDDPSLGTFSQQVWWSSEYWAGPGSPVVMFTPGEVAAAGYTGYLANDTITGLFAQAIGGAVVLVEHRYWGNSSPYDVLSTENLQYLTLENAIADLTNLANNIELPFDPTNSSQAHVAPWVLSGGSYSGALAAWTEATAPGTFWAYHASSAPVEAVFDYWQYFVPVQEGMPANCSKDVSLVIDHIDNVLTTGTDDEIYDLKAMFGLQDVEHNDDFASVLQNGPWSWQSNSFTSGYSAFYQWCDAVENVKSGSIPDENGVGLEVALAGYASYINSSIVPGYCAGYNYGWEGEYNVGCFDTYNASNPIYTDTSVSNLIDRQWTWILCNQPFAYWQDGAPNGTSTLVSRLVTAEYWQRQCGLYFPTEGDYTFGSASGKTVEEVNAWTGGWDVTNTTRLIWANGQYDPWRTAGVSSEFRPDGPLVSTAQAPVNVIPDGIHCSDLDYSNALANEGVAAVVAAEVAQIKTWVSEYNSTAGYRLR